MSPDLKRFTWCGANHILTPGIDNVLININTMYICSKI